MNTIEIGKYIKDLRKRKGFTQSELGEALNISFQTVSKWETGTTLPDSNILLDLSEILNTSVDKILLAGKTSGRNKGIKISKIIDGFDHLKQMKECFGEHSQFYKGAIDGINKSMNMDIENHLEENIMDVLYTEVILQYIVEGYTVDFVEVETYIKNHKMQNIILDYTKKYS
jgi:transcriptional regulator with XRE-family HTH domain